MGDVREITGKASFQKPLVTIAADKREGNGVHPVDALLLLGENAQIIDSFFGGGGGGLSPSLVQRRMRVVAYRLALLVAVPLVCSSFIGINDKNDRHK